MKLVFGMEVGLSPGDFVLDGDPAPSLKGGGAPSTIFGPFLLWPNGWMHQDATWYGCRPQPRGLCVRWRPTPLPKKGAEPPPNFRPIFIVAKWLDASRCHLVYGGRPQPRRLLDGDPALYPKRGGAPPNFRPTSIMAKWLHGSRCHLVGR